jgi:dihydroneopterin aldolase
LNYTIRLQNCSFFARHGVHDEEEVLGQRFFVDAELTVEAGRALEDDDVEGTVDYGAAFKTIEAVVIGHRRKTIEALALDIAKSLGAQYPRIKQSRITVRKPNAPIAGILDHAEVTLVWPG